jgi:hypothetical protein
MDIGLKSAKDQDMSKKKKEKNSETNLFEKNAAEFGTFKPSFKIIRVPPLHILRMRNGGGFRRLPWMLKIKIKSVQIANGFKIRETTKRTGRNGRRIGDGSTGYRG